MTSIVFPGKETRKLGCSGRAARVASLGVARDFGSSVPLHQQPAEALEAIIEEDMPLAAAEGSIACLQAGSAQHGSEEKRTCRRHSGVSDDHQTRGKR